MRKRDEWLGVRGLMRKRDESLGVRGSVNKRDESLGVRGSMGKRDEARARGAIWECPVRVSASALSSRSDDEILARCFNAGGAVIPVCASR